MRTNVEPFELAVSAFVDAVVDRDPEEADRQARIAWVYAEIDALITERQDREANR